MNRRMFVSVAGTGAVLLQGEETEGGSPGPGCRSTSAFRQAREDAPGNAARAHDAQDAGLPQAAWRQSHLRISA